MNVVLIVSDTLRSRNVGFHGHKDVYTPNLDRLAARSMVFDNHYAAGFPTMNARADFFTGRWNFACLGWGPLPKAEPHVGPELTAGGYRTAAVVDTPFYLRNGMNFDLGFKDYFPIWGQNFGESDVIRGNWTRETDRFAPRTALAAADWLERHNREKFFLLVDMWDPHEPWDAPDWYVRMYNPDYDGSGHKGTYGHYKDRGLTEADVKRAAACYAGEVTMMDRWVGYILDMLECMGRMEDTAIIFTTDHGFHFGEHGLMGKLVRKWNEDGSDAGYWLPSPLYEPIAHVPLIIYTPKGKPGRSQALTSAVDIMPTILDLADVKVPAGVFGQSLTPMVQGDDSAGRDFVVTSPEILKLGEATRAVDDVARKVMHWQMATVTTADQWSLLYAAAGEPAELYNLADDPGQEKNVIDSNRSKAEELHARFYQLLEECGVDKEVLKVRKTL